MILTYAQLKSAIASYVDANKIAQNTFTETIDNSAEIIDTIGKIGTLDTEYQVDKLAMFDGEFLEFGKTDEEWSADLIKAEDYDPSGSDALAPHMLTFKKPSFSYTLGRKKWPVTIKYNDFERAVHNAEQLTTLYAIHSKRLMDSKAVWKYAMKREIIGKLFDACDDAMTPATTFAVSTAYSIGDYVKDSNSVPAVVVVDIPNTNADSFDTCVANGKLIPLHLIQAIAKPTDTTTGEAFLEQVKIDCETASDENEGYSLNGNSLGVASSGYVLIVKQGVMPKLEVQVMAGAFNPEKLGLPANTKIAVVKDFGSADDDVYAVLMDIRGIRLFPTYDATRKQENGSGDFITYFAHNESTAKYSRNTFVKFYKDVA